MKRNNRKLPPVTLAIIGLNVLGMIWEYAKGSERILIQYGMYQGALDDGEFVRLAASAFLHFDIFHLLSNLICLGIYGFDLEDRIGPVKFAVIYILGIIGSGLLVNYAGGAYSLHAGASGAVWALMTATLVYNLRNHLNPAYALRGVILNLFYSFSSGISWQSHIGGGIAGLLAALVLCTNQENRQDPYFGPQDGNGNLYR